MYTFIIGYLVLSVRIKISKNFKFNVKTDFWPNKLLPENAKLSLSKKEDWIFVGNSYASTPQVKTALGIKMANSWKLIFEARFTNIVKPMTHTPVSVYEWDFGKCTNSFL